MARCSLQTLKAIAEDVARETGDPSLQVAAVLPGEAHGAYAEVVLLGNLNDAARARLLVGIMRDQPESVISQAFARNLRAAL